MYRKEVMYILVVKLSHLDKSESKLVDGQWLIFLLVVLCAYVGHIEASLN